MWVVSRMDRNMSCSPRNRSAPTSDARRGCADLIVMRALQRAGDETTADQHRSLAGTSGDEILRIVRVGDQQVRARAFMDAPARAESDDRGGYRGHHVECGPMIGQPEMAWERGPA